MRPLYENIPAVSILLMLVTGIVSIVPHGRKAAWRLTLAALVVLCLSGGCVCVALADGRSYTYSLGFLGAPWGNELRAGLLEAMMATAFSFVMLLSVLGGRKDAQYDILPEKQGLYYVMMDLLMASFLALIYTNDLFTGYVFIEINTITACALVMAKEEGQTLAATIRYLIMSLVGSALFLLSVTLLYGITGHLLMESLGPAIAALTRDGSYRLPLAALSCLMICGLAIKSALYPFSSWLPGAHGTATTTSSAVLSGIVIKGYILLLVNIFVRCYGLELVNRLGLSHVLFVLGLAGMIIGSVKAIRETHLKRMIAYSSVAQVGYIFVAIGMGTKGGLVAAYFQILSHAVAKALLFVCAGGLIGVSDHNKQLYELDGAAKRHPLAGIGFTIGALAMVGLPLLGSFVAKLLIAQEAANMTWQTWLALGALGLSGVLNALYYLPAVIRIWMPEKQRAKPEFDGPNWAFRSSVVCLSVGVVVLGVFFAPVVELLRRATGLL